MLDDEDVEDDDEIEKEDDNSSASGVTSNVKKSGSRCDSFIYNKEIEKEDHER